MYSVEYRWMRKPTPVTTSIMVALIASTLKATSIGMDCPSRPVTLNQRHAVHASFAPSCSWLPTLAARTRKVARLARNDPPMAESAMRRTPCLPSRLPKTPLTKAPSAGSASTNASSVKFDAGNCDLNASTLVPQEISVVGAHRLAHPEERKDDGEPHRRLGRGHRDDEEREDLPRVVLRAVPVVRD